MMIPLLGGVLFVVFGINRVERRRQERDESLEALHARGSGLAQFRVVIDHDMPTLQRRMMTLTRRLTGSSAMSGNRVSTLRTFLNLMMTMLLGGLWHGASWLFVIWGGVHGLLLVGERLLRNVFGRYDLFRSSAGMFALGIVTWLFICLTWVLFRADSPADGVCEVRLYVLWIVSVAVVEWR